MEASATVRVDSSSAIGVGNLAGRSMTEILVGDQSEAKLEYLLTDAGQSFSDIVLDIAVEENSR